MLVTIFATIGICAAWLGCGLIGTKLIWLAPRTMIEKKRTTFIGAVLGPLWLLIGLTELYDGFGNQVLYVTRKDRKNPFRNELQDALRLRRGLQWIPGEDAQRERRDLEEVISELREWPSKLKVQDGDRFVAAMRPEYETVKALSRTRLTAFEQIEQEITDEVRNELNT